MNEIFANVRTVNFTLPPTMSYEARDLISGLLQKVSALPTETLNIVTHGSVRIPYTASLSTGYYLILSSTHLYLYILSHFMGRQDTPHFEAIIDQCPKMEINYAWSIATIILGIRLHSPELPSILVLRNYL